jgi:hypothetical protein
MENALSKEIGSWEKLALDAKKYPRLVETAKKLAKQQELGHLKIPVKQVRIKAANIAASRQCPVPENRPVVKARVMVTKETNTTRLWNMLHHMEHGLVTVPATGLNDLAFDKGWRIIHHGLEDFEIPRYTDRFDARQMDEAEFFLTYLEDIEMTEDSAEFFGDIIRPLYEAEQQDNLGAGPDSDEEEIDVEFFGEEQEEQEE